MDGQMGSNDGIYVSDRCWKTVRTLCAHSYDTHIRAQCDWQLWCCDILRCMVATNDTPGTAWHCERTPPNTLISESCWNTFHYCTPSLKPVFFISLKYMCVCVCFCLPRVCLTAVAPISLTKAGFFHPPAALIPITVASPCLQLRGDGPL